MPCQLIYGKGSGSPLMHRRFHCQSARKTRVSSTPCSIFNQSNQDFTISSPNRPCPLHAVLFGRAEIAETAETNCKPAVGRAKREPSWSPRTNFEGKVPATADLDCRSGTGTGGCSHHGRPRQSKPSPNPLLKIDPGGPRCCSGTEQIASAA